MNDNTLYFDGRLNFSGSDEPIDQAAVKQVYDTILAKRDAIPDEVNNDHDGFGYTATYSEDDGEWRLEFADTSDRDDDDLEDLDYEVFFEGSLVAA